MLAISIAPCKGKSFKKSSTYNMFPTSDTRNRILATPRFTGALELNIEYQSRNKPISLPNSVFIPLYMPHTPHERLESPGQQSKLHHRSSHRGDRRGSRFDSPKQKCHFRFFILLPLPNSLFLNYFYLTPYQKESEMVLYKQVYSDRIHQT